MTTERDVAESTSDVDDTLTELNNLGEVGERDLHSLGIRRFADLVKYTPEELAKKLYDQTRKSRYSVAQVNKNDWIGQAKRKLAEQKKGKGSLPQADATVMPEAQALGNQLEDWKLQAEFNLYFENKASGQVDEAWQTRVWKTRIRDRECDKEITFDGIEPRLWVNWILQHADLPANLDLELVEHRTPTPLPSVTPSPAQVSILDVAVEPKSISDLRNKLLVTAVHFTVSDVNAEILTAESIPYQILLLTVDQDRGLTQLVAAEQGLFQPEQVGYTHRLEFPLPDLGRYVLQTIVLIQSQIELLAIHRGPTIKVVP